jgi:alanine racemase
MQHKHVTITQVARAAGVSPTAVSFAFNNPDQIGTKTAERIRAIAREMGYSPNPIARAMISRRTGVIGLLVPLSIESAFINPFIAAFLQGVGSVCDAHSYSVLVVSPYEGSLEEATRRAPVDAYIVLGLNERHEDIDPLRRRRVPFVVVDGDADQVSSINVDDEGGAYAAAAHLLAKGHRDFLILVFDKPHSDHIRDAFFGVGGRRLDGYRRAFNDFGLELPLDRVVQCATSMDGGAQAFRRAWETGLRPTAVLSMSDVKAMGVIRETRCLGVRVPEDLEIIGFDNVPLAALVQPALSTVAQPDVEKGHRAAELLIAALDSETPQPPEKVVFETRLLLRETTR